MFSSHFVFVLLFHCTKKAEEEAAGAAARMKAEEEAAGAAAKKMAEEEAAGAAARKKAEEVWL